jgi:hypothetical protein
MVEANGTLEANEAIVVVAAFRWLLGLIFLLVVVLFLSCHLLICLFLVTSVPEASFSATSLLAASLAALAASFSTAYFSNCLTLTSNM